MRWLGNVRYPPETISDLSDAEWLEALREHYGDENICFTGPATAAVPGAPQRSGKL
jgi:hypothetical protein